MLFYTISILVAILLVGVDQIIKMWATAQLAPVGSMPLIPGIIELRFSLNKGAAFSILQGQQAFLILFTTIAMVAIAVYLIWKRPDSKLEFIAWLLVLSGGVGNLIDRVMNQQVVDYLNFLFMRFAIFNFADILVCTGIGLLLISLLLEEFRANKTIGKE